MRRIIFFILCALLGTWNLLLSTTFYDLAPSDLNISEGGCLNVENKGLVSLAGLLERVGPSAKSIRCLILKNNRLQAVPDIFSKMPNVEYIDLSDNELSYINPKLFDSLASLTCLNLANNPLSNALSIQQRLDRRLVWVHITASCMPYAVLHNLESEEMQKLVSSSDEDHECSICLEDFNKNDEVHKLNCRHHFHVDCIKIWVNKEGKEKTCPLCRKSLLQEEKEHEERGCFIFWRRLLRC